MATDKNALLWAIRGIEDTDTLRLGLIELERVLYALQMNNDYQVDYGLSNELARASGAMYAVIKALPEHNTDLESGLLKLA